MELCRGLEATRQTVHIFCPKAENIIIWQMCVSPWKQSHHRKSTTSVSVKVRDFECACVSVHTHMCMHAPCVYVLVVMWWHWILSTHPTIAYICIRISHCDHWHRWAVREKWNTWFMHDSYTKQSVYSNVSLSQHLSSLFWKLGRSIWHTIVIIVINI